LCEQEPDSGIFPLISGFTPPANRFNPYTKKVEDNTEVPYGTRKKTENVISKFVISSIPNFVSSIAKSKDYDKKIREDKKTINKVVLFSEKDNVPGMFKALATHFRDQIDFYFVNSQKLRKKIKELKISEFPAILIYHDYDESGEQLEERKVVTYSGSNEIQDLIKFLVPFSLSEKLSGKNKFEGEKPISQRRGKYTFVTHKNYTKGVMEDYRTQIIFFHKQFDEIQTVFEDVAKTIHGPTNVVFFNCTDEESENVAKEKFGVKKFPRVIVFSTNSEKKPENSLEISSVVDSEDIINIVTNTEIKDNIREVSDSSISSIFLNNAIQLRKVTLIYLYRDEEDEVPLSFKSISANPLFKDKFDFIALKDPSPQTVQQFQVPKLPTIIGGIPPPEGVDATTPEGQGMVQTMIYQGSLEDYFELLEYQLGVLRLVFPPDPSEDSSQKRQAEITVEFQEVTKDNFEEI
jgi:hypothetical protein